VGELVCGGCHDRVLGRLATKVARMLIGKDTDFTPYLIRGSRSGDQCGQVRMTGSKVEQKIYYSHSGYPGLAVPAKPARNKPNG
jgi:large subunit ribosomal protein L13